MSDYRGIDLSTEFQEMFDTINKIKDTKVREELLDKLDNMQEEISEMSNIIRHVIANLKSL